MKFSSIHKAFLLIGRAFALAGLLIFCAWPTVGHSQTDSTTLISPIDSSKNVPDSTVKKKKYSVRNDLSNNVNYTASDSIIFDMATQTVFLYGDPLQSGNADIKYGKMNLNAARMSINLNTNVVSAYGIADSTGTKTLGRPDVKDGEERFYADSIRYNFKSKKGIIANVATQQGEGYIQGRVIKKNPYNEFFADSAIYTTCDHSHPHFYIRVNKMKLIPEKKVITGPGLLYFFDIPTPFAFPFGYFPLPKTRSSGLIMPGIGESQRSGFYLQNLGLYWAMNDYVGVKISGDAYTNGAWRCSTSVDYAYRYHFTGKFDVRISKMKVGFSELEQQQNPQPTEIWLSWNHTPTGKRSSRFSASVNMGTSTYNQTNSTNITSFASANMVSTVLYSKTFKGTPFNMSVTGRYDQNLQTKVANIDLPNFSFNMNRITPLSRVGKAGKGMWYKNLSVSYTGEFLYKVTNVYNPATTINGYFVGNAEPSDTIRLKFDPFSQLQSGLDTLFARGNWGARHTIPIQTTMKLFKYLSFNPFARITTVQYGRYLNVTPLTTNYIYSEYVNKPNAYYNFSTGASLNTRIYGMLQFKGVIRAFRHTMAPSLTYTYTPDFSTSYFQTVYVGDDTLFVSRYQGQGFVFGAPSKGKANILSFTLDNIFEMKVRNRKDTVKGVSKVKILDNLTIGSSYNFNADSFKLANFSVGARTNLLQKFNIAFNGIVDPYRYQAPEFDDDGTQIRAQKKQDSFLWNGPGGFHSLGQLVSGNLVFTTQLNPNTFKGKDKQDTTKKKNGDLAPMSQNLALTANPWFYYVDFTMPWSLNLSYNMNYTKQGFNKSVYKLILNVSGDVKLTDKWKVGFSTGYDFGLQKSTPAQLNVFRDLHCWEMRMSWSPFSQFQTYTFTIRARATTLQDLKLDKRGTGIY